MTYMMTQYKSHKNEIDVGCGIHHHHIFDITNKLAVKKQTIHNEKDYNLLFFTLLSEEM